MTAEDSVDALLDTIAAPACDFRPATFLDPCGGEPAGMAVYAPCGCTQYLCEAHRVGLLTFVTRSLNMGVGIVCSGISAANAHPHTDRQRVGSIEWRPLA